MTKSSLFATRIDLSIEVREKIISLLNQHLADTFDLYSQTKQAHWNVKGLQFFQLHELFDKLAEEVEDQVDTLAERATSLGGIARDCTSGRGCFALVRVPNRGNHGPTAP